MLKPWLLSDVAADLNARVIGADVAFSAVGTDSRTIAAGQLFVALTGPRFDGHDYLVDVAAKGQSPRWSSVRWRMRRCRNCWWPTRVWRSVNWVR